MNGARAGRSSRRGARVLAGALLVGGFLAGGRGTADAQDAVVPPREAPPTTLGPPAGSSPPPSRPTGGPPPGQEAVRDINLLVHRAVRDVKSTECEFTKQEWKGKPLEKSRALLKHRSNGDVFLRFLSGPNEGRDILYRPGVDDKLLVSNPVMNLHLDPDGYMAMRNNRHTVRMAGPWTVARRILEDEARVKALPPGVATYENLGRKKVLGEWARCYRSVLDKDRYPDFFAHKIEICVAETHGLPIDVTVWSKEGGQLREVGRYQYERCRTNHLTDRDFDPENPAYRF